MPGRAMPSSSCRPARRRGRTARRPGSRTAPRQSVSVQLDTAGPGLPQGRVADAVREPITLSARAVVDDKIVTLSEARLSAGTLGLEASARYDRAADRLEGVIAVRAAEPGTLAPFVGGATWRGLRIETKADLSALSTRPQGTITITGGADDVSLAAMDKRLPALGAVTLASDLGLGADGKITVRSLDIGSALASVKGGGSYLPANQVGDAKATVTLPNLAPLSDLAGVALAGNSTVDLTVNSDRDGIKLGWRGTVSNVTAEGLPIRADHRPGRAVGRGDLAFRRSVDAERRPRGKRGRHVRRGRPRPRGDRRARPHGRVAEARFPQGRARRGRQAHEQHPLRRGSHRPQARGRAQRSRARADRLAQAHTVGDRVARRGGGGEWRGQGERRSCRPAAVARRALLASTPRAA